MIVNYFCRPLRQTISWDAQSSLSGSLRTLSVDSNSMVSHITDVSQSTDNDDVGWSSENSNTDDEDAFGDIAGPAPVSLYLHLVELLKSRTIKEFL